MVLKIEMRQPAKVERRVDKNDGGDDVGPESFLLICMNTPWTGLVIRAGSKAHTFSHSGRHEDSPHRQPVWSPIEAHSIVTVRVNWSGNFLRRIATPRNHESIFPKAWVRPVWNRGLGPCVRGYDSDWT